MSDRSNNELRKGCLLFALIVAGLAILSGTSVLLLGKKAAPKARTVIISKPQTRFSEISAKLEPNMAKEVKSRFLHVLELYLREIETEGAVHSQELVKSSEYLEEIQQDGKISVQEAVSWTDMTEEVLREK